MSSSRYGAAFNAGLMISRVCFAFLDEITDIIYYTSGQFPESQVSIQKAILFVLIASPCLQVFIWAILLAMEDVDYYKYDQKINQANSTKQYIKFFILENSKYILRLALIAILKIPKSILIAIGQELKLFPFFLFFYTYTQYKTLITTDLMENLNIEFKKKKKQQQSEQQSSIYPALKHRIQSSFLQQNNSQNQKYSRKSSSQVEIMDENTRNSQNRFSKQQNKRKSFYNDNSLQSDHENGGSNSNHNIDLILDANLKPTFSKILNDENLSKFFLIADMLEAVSESLPMCILQFINNEQQELWYTDSEKKNLDLFILASFLLSISNVILHIGLLTMVLMEGTVKIFFETLQHLKQEKKESKEEWRGLGNLFSVTQCMVLDSVARLQKFKSMQPEGLQNVTSLVIDIENQSFNKDLITNYTQKSLERANNIQILSIRIEKNNLDDTEIKDISYSISRMKCLRMLEFRFGQNNVTKKGASIIRSYLRKLQNSLEIQIISGDGFFIYIDQQDFQSQLKNEVSLKNALQTVVYDNIKLLPYLDTFQLQYKTKEISIEELEILQQVIQQYQELEVVLINLGHHDFEEEKRDQLVKIFKNIEKLPFSFKLLLKANSLDINFANSEQVFSNFSILLHLKEFTLKLRNNKIMESGAIQLSETIKNLSSIKNLNLDLQSNEIMNGGFLALTEAIRYCDDLQQLSLNISNNSIEDCCIFEFGKMIKLQQVLKHLHLDLKYNSIQSQVCYEFCQQIGQLRQIKDLYINFTLQFIEQEEVIDLDQISNQNEYDQNQNFNQMDRSNFAKSIQFYNLNTLNFGNKKQVNSVLKIPQIKQKKMFDRSSSNIPSLRSIQERQSLPLTKGKSDKINNNYDEIFKNNQNQNLNQIQSLSNSKLYENENKQLENSKKLEKQKTQLKISSVDYCIAHSLSQTLNDSANLQKLDIDLKHQIISKEGIKLLGDKLALQMNLQDLILNLSASNITSTEISDIFLHSLESLEDLNYLTLNLNFLNMDINVITHLKNILLTNINNLEQFKLYIDTDELPITDTFTNIFQGCGQNINLEFLEIIVKIQKFQGQDNFMFQSQQSQIQNNTQNSENNESQDNIILQNSKNKIDSVNINITPQNSNKNNISKQQSLEIGNTLNQPLNDHKCCRQHSPIKQNFKLIKNIQYLQNLEKLKVLTLNLQQYSIISHEFKDFFSNLVNLEKLDLNLSQCKLYDPDISYIFKGLEKCQNIIYLNLDFSENIVTVKGAPFITNYLQKNGPQLIELNINISHNELKTKGAVDIVSNFYLLRRARKIKFNIANNGLGQEVRKYLKNHISNQIEIIFEAKEGEDVETGQHDIFFDEL